MKRQMFACLLAFAIASSGSGLMAQMVSGGGTGPSATPLNNNANNNANNSNPSIGNATNSVSPGSNSAMSAGTPSNARTSGNMTSSNVSAPASNAPALNTPQPVNDNGLRISMGDTTAVNGMTQLEGQLVDVYSLAKGSTPLMTGSSESGGSAAAAGLKPNNMENNTGTGAINGRGNGMSGSTGTLVPTPAANNPSGNQISNSIGVAPGSTSSSFGTYDHPGSTAGPGNSALQTGMVGNGIAPNKPVEIRNGMTPADAATGTGTASAGNHPADAHPDDALIRQRLSNGVPAAILANGQAYILATDPRQLATYAGQDVRISGDLSANRVLVPNNFQVKSANGSFQTVALPRPDQPQSHTASER